MVGVHIPFGYSYWTWLNKIQILVRESCRIVNFCLCRKFYSKMYTQTTSCLNYIWNNNNKRFVSASSDMIRSPSSSTDDGDRNMNFGVIGIWTWSFCINVLFKAVKVLYILYLNIRENIEKIFIRGTQHLANKLLLSYDKIRVISVRLSFGRRHDNVQVHIFFCVN